uniref:G_PROTEIN_RECEP_F1_2 domain-containing protein n=1 Tax=Caenorhabditis tropicalis TaxID=1561998 RepID=A0A1I7TMW8_9PELO
MNISSNVTIPRVSSGTNQLYFLVVHQTVVMTVSLLGNLFLLFVIFRGNHVMKRRVSPVQLLIIHTCVADLLFALLSLGTEILTLVNCVCKAVRLSSTKSVRAMDSQKKNGKLSTEATENYIEELRKKSKGFRQQMSEFDRKRVQTVRLTITIVACNFFLWMPFCVINVIQALWPEILHSMFISYVAILGNLNSCLNPWIYILFNRSHVKKALCQARGSFSEVTTKRSFENFECSSTVTMNNNRSNAKYKQVHQRSYSTDCTTMRTST